MKEFSFSLILLLFAPFIMAQEVEEVSTVEEVSSLQKEIRKLKVDVLIQQMATLQAKATWLDRERMILAFEEQKWNAEKARLEKELGAECESGIYLFDKRKCKEIEIEIEN